MRIASRMARLGVVAACLLALVAAPNQPVQARTTADITFQGVATLGAGLDAPCLDATTTTTGNPPVITTTFPLPCPPPANPPMHCDLPLNPADPVDVLNCHPHYGHNLTSVGISTNVCQGSFTAVKSDKPQVEHAGGCSITTIPDPKPDANTVSGWCGRSGGQVVVRITDPLGQTYIADVHFQTGGTGVVFAGHWWKHFRGNNSNHGKVTGETTAVPPTPAVTPNESCTNKTARNFVLAGTATLVPSPTLP